MALAAIEAGKHVYCESRLHSTAAECLEMALAAERNSVQTAVDSTTSKPDDKAGKGNHRKR